MASRLQGGEPFAAPTLAPLRSLLGPAFDDLADLLLPAADGNSAAAPTAPGPAAVAAAQLFATAAGTPTPPYEAAKSALGAMRQLGWLSAPVLDALSAELTERYTPRPRVLVAGKDGGPLVEVGRMLQGQGFAPMAVRTRAELAPLLREAVALVAEAAHPELGSARLAELRRDPRFAQFPVFLLAGTNEAAAVTRALEAGADDVFTPPLNEAVLTAKLKRLVQARASRA